MRKIDRLVEAADASGRRITMLLGKTPDGTKTFAMRHDDVGTITATVTDDDLDEMIAELQALRAET